MVRGLRGCLMVDMREQSDYRASWGHSALSYPPPGKWVEARISASFFNAHNTTTGVIDGWLFRHLEKRDPALRPGCWRRLRGLIAGCSQGVDGCAPGDGVPCAPASALHGRGLGLAIPHGTVPLGGALGRLHGPVRILAHRTEATPAKIPHDLRHRRRT